MTNPSPYELPLFPLGVVLFPGMTLPLRIFEERYKLMMKRCLEGDQTFGVVLIKSGQEVGGLAVPFEIGTRARIVRVTPQPEGRMSLVTVGEEVFRIVDISQEKPYMVGLVEYLERPRVESEEVEALASRVKSHFETYVSIFTALAGEGARELSIETDPEKLSYQVASIMTAGMRKKQWLLEVPSVMERLQEELRLLQEETLALKLFLDRKMAAEAAGEGGKEAKGPRFSSN